jgi:iron(III) transport system substrate-binding protein
MLTGCATGSASARATSVTITLYNGQHPETTSALVSAFQSSTGIHVAVRDDDEDVLADEIVAEGGRSPADVIYTENSPALEYLQEHDLLAPVTPATLSLVPDRYSSPEHDWVGVSARVSVLIYNTSLVKPSELPTSILDLAKPVWAGRLALAPSETDFQPIITSVIKTYGKAKALSWLEALKSNAAGHIYPDNETVTAQVNAGRAALGVIDHYYWYRLRAEIGQRQIKSALWYFAPKDAGYVLDVSGAAVLSSSHHLAQAEEFLHFLVSKKGEEIIAKSDSFEYPLGSKVATAQPLKAFASLQPTPLSITELGNGATAVALLQQAGLL